MNVRGEARTRRELREEIVLVPNWVVKLVFKLMVKLMVKLIVEFLGRAPCADAQGSNGPIRTNYAKRTGHVPVASNCTKE